MPVAFPAVPTEALIGAQYNRQPGRLEFAPDIGPSISRRRTTLAIKEYEIRFKRWTSAELATFETWYETTAGGGVEEFTLTDPETQALAVWRFASGQTYRVEILTPEFRRVSIRVLRLRDA